MTLQDLIDLLNIFIISPTTQNMDNISDFAKNPENTFILSKSGSKELTTALNNIEAYRAKVPAVQGETDFLSAEGNLNALTSEIEKLKNKLLALESPDYITD